MREETKQGVKWYVIVVIGIMITGIIFGGYNLFFKKTFGVAEKNVEHEIHVNTRTHIEGMIKKLSNYQYEYDTVEDEVEKKAIARLVRNEFSNFDLAELDNNPELKQFLIDARNNNLK